MGNSNSSSSSDMHQSESKKADEKLREANSVSSQRPTDEAIIKFEQTIKEKEVDSFPIVSELFPIHVLQAEYADGADGFKSKLEELEKVCQYFRRCRGDGNCFFRAFGFGFIEAIGKMIEQKTAASSPASIAEHAEAMVGEIKARCNKWLEAAKFEKLAYEDFFEEFIIILREYLNVVNNLKSTHEATESPTISPTDWLADDWQRQEYRSNSIVVLLRMVASAYLRLHADQYEPFIYDSIQIDPYSKANAKTISPIELFCQRYVECIGQESDQIHIIAISKALGCLVNIAYLDGNSSQGLVHLEFGATEPEDQPIADLPKIYLLYRPGHYDVLYRTS